MRVDARLLKDHRDPVDERGLAELLARQVDGDGERLVEREHLLPALHLAARLAQNPLAELDDHARLFGDRDEVHRRDEAALRVLPPDERLEAAQAEVFERDDGLVVEYELLSFERAAHVGLHL